MGMAGIAFKWQQKWSGKALLKPIIQTILSTILPRQKNGSLNGDYPVFSSGCFFVIELPHTSNEL